MRAAVVLVLLLAGCADYQPTPAHPASPCPPLVTYTLEEQVQADAELDTLPDGSMVERMLDDYGTMRSLCR